MKMLKVWDNNEIFPQNFNNLLVGYFLQAYNIICMLE